MLTLQNIRRFVSAETVVILLHLSLFSQLGVLTRVYVDRLFNDGCYSGWGLCLTSAGGRDKTYGAHFTDLPANMLGCFIMGLLSTAAVLGLRSKKAVAILPASHPWQSNSELLVGLRTGYCGSLTTFASWEFSLLQLLVGVKGGDGGQWQQWLWGWIVGFELAFASHVIGEHLALLADSRVIREEPKAEMTQLERPTEASEEGEELYGSQELQEVLHGENYNSTKHSHNTGTNQQGSLDVGLQQPAKTVQGEAANLHGPHQPQHVHPAPDMYGAQQSQHSSGGQARRNASMFPSSSVGQPANYSQASKPSTEVGQLAQHATHKKQEQTVSGSTSSKLTPITAACALLCVVLTALWVVLAIVDSESKHSGRRQQWFALLFAPFGCILRWLLSKLNTRSGKNMSPWFPLGTFLANMIACGIDFVIGGISNRYTLGYWPAVILPAVRVGYAGSLSTVSTFIAEVRAQLQGWPEKLHGYIYPFVTIASGVVLGIALYGWSVWRTL